MAASEVQVQENPHRVESPYKPEQDIPDELLVKHPLENSWALWFFKKSHQDWAQNLKEITKFNTVEDFWAVYNHVQKASKIPAQTDYYFFKEGIFPMWEDDQNKHGGRWLINLDRNQRSTHLDIFWLELLLCLIGEAFGDYSHSVCGAVVNIRARGDKINLWTRDTKEASVISIGRTLKERLNIPDKVTIGFNAHEESSRKAGSSVKYMFQL